VKVLHYTARWLDLSMGFVHAYVVGSRHPGVVVCRQKRLNAAAFPTPRPLSLSLLERGRGHAARGAALEAIASFSAAEAVHVHMGYAAPDVTGLVRRHGLPLVLSLHGNDVTAFAAEHPGFYDQIAGLTSKVVSPSRWLAERIVDLGFAASDVFVVPSGVDTSFFASSLLSDGPPTVTFVGRLVPKKGIDVLMDAWPRVLAAVPGADLHVVGDGPLSDLVRGPGVRWERPMLEDRRGQVRRAMAGATVVATPSHTGPDGDAESLLLVNLEAQASGRAVVTTRHGGIPEYVTAETAVVVSEGSASELAEALIGVLRDRDRAAAMGEAGAAWVAQFDERACIAARDDVVSAAAERPMLTPAPGPRLDAANRAPCSVVLPTRDRPEKLDRALTSIVGALNPGDELVVVDSASRDPRVASVATGHGATVVRCDEPGVNRARNAGWRATTHDSILYVDDDVVVDSGWADAMVAALGAHPEAGFVSGRIEVPPGQVTSGHQVAIKDDPEPVVLTASSPGIIGHSASLGVRRQALDSVGGWDAAMGAGGRFKSSPEVDLFDRLFAHGWVGWYEPSALAWHDQWRGKSGMLHLDWRYGYGAGARIAKLVRTDRSRAGVAAREVFWRQGLRAAYDNARRGYKTPVLLNLAGVAGATAGLVRALPVRVRDGQFVERSSG
jgi:glycosyltransferase involved in cell wall biosynthesis